jgi:hypothetical protein
MNERSIAIIGLPESGKTTFLAALWHLLTERDPDVPTALRFHTLRSGESTYLNQIAARWRDAVIQDRTGVGGNRVVSMNLLDGENVPVRVTFPDVPGEAYRRMWEERDCEPAIAEMLQAEGVLLFIHADTIRAPKWIVDEIALSKSLGLPIPADGVVSWHPRLSPTQVSIVDLLQLLRSKPLDIGPRRLAIILSAWDKAEGDSLPPLAFLEQKMPLLGQYLNGNIYKWNWRVFGLSAQGGDYDPADPKAARKPQAQELRDLDKPSTRIRLVDGERETHDLTEPLAWLMT